MIIKFKSNNTLGVTPTAAQLALGELAVNTVDGVISFKDTADNIIKTNSTVLDYTDILIPGTVSPQYLNIDSNWIKLDGTNIPNSNIPLISSNMPPALDITEITLPAVKYWTRGAFVNNKFIAASADTIAVSDDGVTWDTYTTPEVNLMWSDIEYFNGYYYFASVSNILFYTADFVSWSTLATNGYCIRLHKFGSSRLTLITRINIYHTTNGTTWTTISVIGTYLCTTSVQANDLIIRLYFQSSSSAPQLMYSTNQGVSWVFYTNTGSSAAILINTITPQLAKSAVWTGDKFVFCNSSLSNQLGYSYDGLNWDSYFHPIAEKFYNIVSVGSYVYFFVRDKPYIYVSRAVGPLNLEMQPFNYNGFVGLSSYSGSTVFMPRYNSDEAIVLTESLTHSYLLNQQDAPVKFLYKGV